jgi:hypothetical protein
MYKVYEVPGGWQIFWCPSWPKHDMDKIPHTSKVYSKRPAAYRRVKQLNDALEAEKKKEEKAVA